MAVLERVPDQVHHEAIMLASLMQRHAIGHPVGLDEERRVGPPTYGGDTSERLWRDGACAVRLVEHRDRPALQPQQLVDVAAVSRQAQPLASTVTGGDGGGLIPAVA